MFPKKLLNGSVHPNRMHQCILNHIFYVLFIKVPEKILIFKFFRPISKFSLVWIASICNLLCTSAMGKTLNNLSFFEVGKKQYSNNPVQLLTYPPCKFKYEYINWILSDHIAHNEPCTTTGIQRKNKKHFSRHIAVQWKSLSITLTLWLSSGSIKLCSALSFHKFGSPGECKYGVKLQCLCNSKHSFKLGMLFGPM